jgi:hypothetical protein
VGGVHLVRHRLDESLPPPEVAAARDHGRETVCDRVRPTLIVERYPCSPCATSTLATRGDRTPRPPVRREPIPRAGPRAPCEVAVSDPFRAWWRSAHCGTRVQSTVSTDGQEPWSLGPSRQPGTPRPARRCRPWASSTQSTTPMRLAGPSCTIRGRPSLHVTLRPALLGGESTTSSTFQTIMTRVTVPPPRVGTRHRSR